MNSQQKIINILTICRKAGRMVAGFDAVKEAIYEGNVSCVIITEDISDKTLKEVRFICKNAYVEIIELELDSYDMFDVAGKQVVVAAICDHGFAKKISTLQKGADPYPAAAKTAPKSSSAARNPSAAKSSSAAKGSSDAKSSPAANSPQRTRRKRKSEKNNGG